MQKNNILIVVEDDADDQELMLLSLQSLGAKHEIRMFSNAESALEYLYKTSDQPFMIVSDINMPKMNGLSFKKAIDRCDILRAKCIPFVFLSTSTKFLKDTCDLNIQGYFEKGNTLGQLNETMRIVLLYWERTRHMNPN
jgi:two-component SAPR family response regulator